MTISTTTRKAGPFVGNGVTTSFPFTFKVFQKADVAVYKLEATGVESLLVLDANYSVTLNGDQDAAPGGSITFPITGSPLAATEQLVVVGAMPDTQPQDLLNGGGFFPRANEDGFDRSVALIQQVSEKVGRALLSPVTSPALNLTLPTAAARANRIFSWDATGQPRATLFASPAIIPRGLWVTATSYAFMDAVIFNGSTYIAAVAHTSAAAFATDLAANRWLALSDNDRTVTVQTFLSGSGTYVRPANCKQIRPQLVGGGAGGTGGGTSPGNGGSGGNTTFGASLLTANGAPVANAPGNYPGSGGSGTVNAPAVGYATPGGAGSYPGENAPAGAAPGGKGGDSYFGGGGASAPFAAGLPGAANSGSGGGGGGSSGGVTPGSGGGAGGYVEAVISIPAASYPYGIGGGGSAGTAGTSGFVGGVGAAGRIIVWEFY